MKSGPDESGLNCHVRQGSCLWQASPPISDDEDDFDPTAPYEFVEGTFERKRKGAPQNMKKFGRYPFMPSMLAGGECDLPNSAPRDWASSVLEHPVFVCRLGRPSERLAATEGACNWTSRVVPESGSSNRLSSLKHLATVPAVVQRCDPLGHHLGKSAEEERRIRSFLCQQANLDQSC